MAVSMYNNMSKVKIIGFFLFFNLSMVDLNYQFVTLNFSVLFFPVDLSLVVQFAFGEIKLSELFLYAFARGKFE